MTEENKNTNNSETNTTPAKKFKFPKMQLNAMPMKLNMGVIFGIFAVILLVVGAVYLKGLFVAAMVNGKPITRLALVKELQKQGGKQVLESMVVRELLEQEAKKTNIQVTQDDLDKELKAIESYLTAQGSTLDQFLLTQSITKDDLTHGLKVKIIQDKLTAGKDVVTEAEINAYLEENKAALPKDQDVNTLKPQIQQSLQQQKQQAAQQELIIRLKSEAKILFW